MWEREWNNAGINICLLCYSWQWGLHDFPVFHIRLMFPLSAAYFRQLLPHVIGPTISEYPMSWSDSLIVIKFAPMRLLPLPIQLSSHQWIPFQHQCPKRPVWRPMSNNNCRNNKGLPSSWCFSLYMPLPDDPASLIYSYLNKLRSTKLSLAH